MRPEGIIFDCDGTLIHSLDVWKHAVAWLFEKYPATRKADLEEVEALCIEDTCTYFVEVCGMQADPAHMYEDICAYVREHYRDETSPLPHVESFLEELTRAGIPLIVASSSPKRELKTVLAIHGLDRFFVDAVSTEDVGGRDKEFPDVYLEAAARIGAVPDRCWVFEDAPFGLSTARKAGFLTVGIYNEGDGRDFSDIQRRCDMLIRSYEEISLTRLFDFEPEAPQSFEGGDPYTVLIVGGSPEQTSGAYLKHLVDSADFCIAADGGIGVLRRAGLTCDLWCGDGDSADASDLAWIQEHKVRCIVLPSHKDCSDLSLACNSALYASRKARRRLRVVVTSSNGGRLDHTLAQLGVLSMSGAAEVMICEDSLCAVLLGEDRISRFSHVDQSFFLRPIKTGDTLSLISLTESSVVSTEGLTWNLSNESLPALSDRGLSNVVADSQYEVVCEQGQVLVLAPDITTKTPQ